MQLVQRVTRWEVKIAVVAELILRQQPQSVPAVGSCAEPKFRVILGSHQVVRERGWTLSSLHRVTGAGIPVLF